MKNGVLILVGVVLVGIIVYLIAKPDNAFAFGGQSPTKEPGASSTTQSSTQSSPATAPAGMEVVKYFVDDRRVNPDITYLQKQINLQTVGVNRYKLATVVEDGKLGDKTATEFAKVDATIGKEVKAKRAITKEQMRAIIRKIGTGWQ